MVRAQSTTSKAVTSNVTALKMAAPIVENYTIKSIDRSEVLRYVGYHGQKITPEMDADIDRAMSRCIDVGKPRGVIRVFDIEGIRDDANGVPEVHLVDTPLVLKGHDIANHLKDAVAAGVMAVTLGMVNERERRAQTLINQVAGIFFDAASTTLVERAADAAESTIVRLGATRDLYPNFRFSPGYGDLPLACQPALLASLDAERLLGLTLTPSYLLVPMKSVSAIVGLFATPQDTAAPSCSKCNCYEFCTVRREGRTCRG